MLALPNQLILIAPLLTMGFADALVRLLPMAKATPSEYKALRESSLGVGLLLGGVLVLVALGQWSLNQSFPSPNFTLAVLAIFCGAGNYLFKFFYCDLSGTHSFRTLAWAQFLHGLIRVGLVLTLLVLLPEPWRLYALYAGMLISFTFVDGWLVIRWLRELRFRIQAHSCDLLFRQGIAISMVALTNTMLATADRLVVSRIFEPHALGLFEQSVLLREALLLMPSVLMTVFIPGYSRGVAEKKATDEMARVMMRQNLLLLVALLPLLGLGFINLPWILHLLLPNYIQGAELYQWTCVAAIPLIVAYLPLSLLISVGKPWRVAFGGMLAIVMALLLDWQMLGPLDLLPALQNQILAWSVYCCLLFVFVIQLLPRIRQGIPWILANVASVAWLVLALFYSRCWSQLLAGEQTGFMYYIWRNLLLLLGYLPVLYLYAKLSGRSTTFRRMLRPHFRRESDHHSKEG